MTIAKLMQTYRAKMNVPAGSKITLLLDGDPLDEDETVKNLDLDDGDQLDVQIETA